MSQHSAYLALFTSLNLYVLFVQIGVSAESHAPSDPGTLDCYLQQMKALSTHSGEYTYRLLASRRDVSFDDAIAELKDPKSEIRYRFSDPGKVDGAVDKVENGEFEAFREVYPAVYEIDVPNRVLVFAEPSDCRVRFEGEKYEAVLAKLAPPGMGGDALSTATLTFNGKQLRTRIERAGSATPSEIVTDSTMLDDGFSDLDPRRIVCVPIQVVEGFGTGYVYSPEESSDARHVYLMPIYNNENPPTVLSHTRLELDPFTCSPLNYDSTVPATGGASQSFRIHFTNADRARTMQPALVITESSRPSGQGDSGQSAASGWRTDAIITSWRIDLTCAPQGIKW